MKLNRLEFFLMNNPVRAYVQEIYELPILMNMLTSQSNESFDAIFDFGIIHHIPNWKNCIAELRRVLKADGKLILEELSIDSFSGWPGKLYKSVLAHPYDKMFSIDKFVKHIEKVGLKINSFKKPNPLKMIEHFSLVASVR